MRIRTTLIGLLDDKGGRAYPRSTLRLSEEELAFWFSDEKKAAYPDKAMMFDLARKNIGLYKDAGAVETFKLGADLGGGIHSLALPGIRRHTGLRISDGKEQFLIWADLVHVPALQFAHPEISIAFDIDPEQARATRTKIFAEVQADRLRGVAGMHLVSRHRPCRQERNGLCVRAADVGDGRLIMTAQHSLKDLTESAIIHWNKGQRAEAFELACMAAAKQDAGHMQNLLFAQTAAGLK